jgi:hypothetical protein
MGGALLLSPSRLVAERPTIKPITPELNMTQDQEAILALTGENQKLKLALDDIGRLAMGCWMDMQGRILDSEHERAHKALGNIAARAADAAS